MPQTIIIKHSAGILGKSISVIIFDLSPSHNKSQLLQAQINAPIMQSIRKFPNSVGAILRQRHEEHLKPAQRPAECIRRCAYFDQNTKEK